MQTELNINDVNPHAMKINELTPSTRDQPVDR